MPMSESMPTVKEIHPPAERNSVGASVIRPLLSRTTILSLIALILGAVLTADMVPQRFLAPVHQWEAWRTANPHALPIVDALGLHHVYTTPWFAGLILLVSLSLILSTSRQFGQAWRRTFVMHPADTGGGAVVRTTDEELSSVLRKQGYFPVGEGTSLRYVKHLWGYWGNFFLHAGIVVTIAGSLFAALTQQRGVRYLTEGEICPPSALWLREEHGLLAKHLELPGAVRVDKLELRFNPDSTVNQAASEISFISPDGRTDHGRVAINAILRHRGLRIYQSNDYGDAFTVELTDAAGKLHRERLQIFHPSSIDRAGYNDFELPWLPLTLSAKYYADAAGKSMTSPDRLLVLRLVDRGREISRISLKAGESGVLGGMGVRLVGVEKWSGLIFVNMPGMAGVFFGFFIIVLGVILHYCTPPRELHARRVGDGLRLSWKAARFAEFYDDEYRTIIAAMGRRDVGPDSGKT